MYDDEIVKRAERAFLNGLGFDENPFASTNADDEERLFDYFIPPPYFSTVFGDPDKPKSFVVFAPRGGGKSAQRKMIEQKSSEEGVLSITYSQFDFPNVERAEEATIKHHLFNIIRYTLVGIIVTINSDKALLLGLDKQDKEILTKLASRHLNQLNESSLSTAIESLRSFKQKAQMFWNEWVPALGPSLTVFFKKLFNADLGQMAQLDKFANPDSITANYLKHDLGLLIGIAKKIGYRSVYILIDRVDEAAITGDPTSSFRLLEPLFKDIGLLELNGLGIKFFLWDQLEPLYTKVARRDRVRQETLEWDDDMLKDMWQKRLRAFSSGRLSTLAILSDVTLEYSPDDLALIFANHSPRDMIRIGDRVIAEQQQINNLSIRIAPEAIYKGIEKFCHERAYEIITNERVINNLRRTRRVTFTIPYLANIVFREQQASTRNRLAIWRKEGAIIDIDKVDNPNPDKTQQVKLLGIADIRVAKIIFPDLDLPTFLQQKYKRCPKCHSTVLREWGDKENSSICQDCQFDLLTDEDQDPWDIWQRKQIATQNRNRHRKETIQTSQVSIFDYLREHEEGSDNEQAPPQ